MFFNASRTHSSTEREWRGKVQEGSKGRGKGEGREGNEQGVKEGKVNGGGTKRNMQRGKLGKGKERRRKGEVREVRG